MSVIFKPWVGQHYDARANKLLVVGDSHYCGSCDRCGVRGNCSVEEMGDCVDFTRGIVSDYLAWRNDRGERADWMSSSFLTFDRIYYGKKYVSAEETNALWESIAFCNFLQTAISSEPSNTNYTDEDYFLSTPMLAEVMETLRPDSVIIWGNKAWDHTPDRQLNYKAETENCGTFSLEDGHIIRAMKMVHPSRANQAKWHKEIADFLRQG